MRESKKLLNKLKKLEMAMKKRRIMMKALSVAIDCIPSNHEDVSRLSRVKE